MGLATISSERYLFCSADRRDMTVAALDSIKWNYQVGLSLLICSRRVEQGRNYGGCFKIKSLWIKEVVFCIFI